MKTNQGSPRPCAICGAPATVQAVFVPDKSKQLLYYELQRGLTLGDKAEQLKG